MRIDQLSDLAVFQVVAVERSFTRAAARLGVTQSALSQTLKRLEADLAKADTWLQALTQNAWDTGAGWGLILVYAAYMRKDEDTTRSSRCSST